MNILVIDAHGGGVGKALVSEIKKALPETTVTAVGTNSVATTAMKRQVLILRQREKTRL